MTIGRRLLLARKDLHITQKELARLANIDRAYISNLENDNASNPTLGVIDALAVALGVRPEYLAGWSDDATGEDRPPSLAEGRIVYQVTSATEYRLAQELLDLLHELSPDNRHLLVRLAQQLRHSDNARIIE